MPTLDQCEQRKDINHLVHEFGDEKELYKVLKEKYILPFHKLELNGYPIQEASKGEREQAYLFPDQHERFVSTYRDVRCCLNCKKSFSITEYSTEPPENNCQFHWGKKPKKPITCNLLRRNHKKLVIYKSPYETQYFCCGQPYNSEGCTTRQYHVHQQITQNDLNCHFKSTEAVRPYDRTARRVYALDCEMIFTTLGSEVVKVVLLDRNGTVLIDTFVQPRGRVIDLNTRTSGITEEDLMDVDMTFDEMRAKLFEHIKQDTILIGQSLEFDFRALKMIHMNVVDTSMLFQLTEKDAKYSLKSLARDLLNLKIQRNGHNPVEDAMTTLRLVYQKIELDQRKEFY
ncbi:unnamed protein product [Bursaphelenchus okinawaensis]|uniref:Exonuclease domain-containing protein n=1 Tax=Bursaphelenchus okinawaensis TaxID=465554 RepID=A0A811K3E8_9BILA|nr:unnamed protein product [Bursaphelenchus okinawaensis]CAG9089780.1 unnamed protein product [Bursaphelenchus okinawaensis]